MNVAEVNLTSSVSGTDEKKDLTALDAARQLGIELNRVYVLLRLGRLAGRKVDGKWRVSISGVEERLQRRQRITA
jgi:hypothetical protein